MSTASEWKDLARRAREAAGPNRDIDVQIAQAAFPEIGDYKELCAGDGPLFWHGPYRKQICPNFTASIDAIVALIEKTLPGWKGRTEIGDGDSFYANLFKPAILASCAFALTPALALVTAYCEARASIKEGE